MRLFLYLIKAKYVAVVTHLEPLMSSEFLQEVLWKLWDRPRVLLTPQKTVK